MGEAQGLGLTVDAQLSAALDRVAGAAHAFYIARHARNPEYDWLTESEKVTLESLRATLADLAREEAKPRRGVAA